MKATAIEPCPSRTLLSSTKISKDTKLLIVAMAITTVIAFATGLPGLDLVVKEVHAQVFPQLCTSGTDPCNDTPGRPLGEPEDKAPICGGDTGIICVPPEYICEKNPHARGCEYREGLPGDDATTVDDFLGKGKE